MASLTAHIRRTDDHGRLGFHPECPICRRERLSGAPPTDAIAGPRNQALLAASVLALSTASPTAVLAADLDKEEEGTAAPEQIAGDRAQPPPAFDPGGESADLPVVVGSPPEASAAPDPAGETVPLEQEPLADEVAPVADAVEVSGAQSIEQQQQPPTADPPPAPPAAEPAASEPTPNASAPEAPAPTDQGPQTASGPPPQVQSGPPPQAGSGSPPQAEPQQRRTAKPDNGAPKPAAVAPVQATPPRPVRATPPQPLPATPPQPVRVAFPTVASGSMTVRVTHRTATQRKAAQSADRFHVVQNGESLWSIAKDLLGDDVSVARIAREVNRLWELNSERIGTGEPDLVIAGTRIALR